MPERRAGGARDTAETTPPESPHLNLNALVHDLRTETTPFLVLFVAATSLIATEYLVMPAWFHGIFPEGSRPLSTFTWWAAVYVLAWFVLPLGVAARRGRTWRDLGLSAKGLAPKLWAYGVLYLIALAFVALAAVQPRFLEMYPFLRADQTPSWSWRLLGAFWLLYGIQFFCVEFFFRGFMIFMLRPRFGYAAIAVMVVPYAMIHFDKPLPEAVAAVIGGTVLGWLALKTNSIWGGVLLHVAVALTMDTFAMLQNETGFPAVW